MSQLEMQSLSLLLLALLALCAAAAVPSCSSIDDDGNFLLQALTQANEATLVTARLDNAYEYAQTSSFNKTAVIDSEGFMNETDATWKMRKQRQMRQVLLQREALATCPDNAWWSSLACFPSCSSSSQDSVARFLTCREENGSDAVHQGCSAPAIKDCPGEVFWQIFYEPSFSCMFKRRIGNAGEGGKWVCDPYLVAQKPEVGQPCLIYSVGSNGQYDFEEAVHKEISSACEIHTIDKNDWNHYGRGPPPSFVTYHKFTMGVPPAATSLSTIVHELGHESRTIDIFKIDCEGCEWDTFRSWFGQGVYIRQILVELHGTGHVNGSNAHDFFNFLFNLGYVIFSKEPNTLGCGGSCIEYGFLKMSPGFARGVQT